MKIKKRVAGLLATIMIVNATSVFGNTQNRLPSDGISPIVVNHTLNTSTGDISPTAQITFKKATNTADNQPNENPINYESEATFYSFILNDINGKKIVSNRFNSTGKDIYVENIEDHLVNINDFKNGNLYKVEVEPGHFHYDSENRPYDAPLSSATKNPYKFFLTDFNTIMREKNDEMEVVWEIGRAHV